MSKRKAPRVGSIPLAPPLSVDKPAEVKYMAKADLKPVVSLRDLTSKFVPGDRQAYVYGQIRDLLKDYVPADELQNILG